VLKFGLGQQIAPELLIKAGEIFSRTCTVPMERGLNVTCTLPSSGGGSTSSDTVTQRHNNEATLYLRKVNAIIKYDSFYQLIINFLNEVEQFKRSTDYVVPI
jgi:hypothetical protein